MKTRKSLTLNILLILAILVVANALSSGLFLRLDFTQDSRYTLSDATRSILRQMDEPVTVTAYFSRDLPPNVAKNRQDFREMLEEYAALSRGNLVYEFLDPASSADIEAQCMQKGIQPFLINVREKDQVKQQKAYMGAVASQGDRQEVIPFIPIGSAMEYTLSRTIKKVGAAQRPRLAFVQGHGEPGPQDYQQAMAELGELYDVEWVDLGVPGALDPFPTAVVVAPTDTIAPEHLAQLDRFADRGGNLLVALNRVGADLQQARGFEVGTGIEEWLARRGVEVEPSFLVDNSCGNITVAQQTGMFRMHSQVAFPYLPLFTHFGDHAITGGLEQVLLQFASPVSYRGDTAFRWTPLLVASDMAGTAPAATYFDVQKRWTAADFGQPGLCAAGLLESTDPQRPLRMVVVGDGDFAVNGAGPQAQSHQADNINLLVNAVDYLADDTGLIQLRTRGVTSRPIATVDDATKALLRYANFLLPLALVVGYGVVRSQRRKMTRIRRTQKGYVD